jgi:hypothetical protein
MAEAVRAVKARRGSMEEVFFMSMLKGHGMGAIINRKDGSGTWVLMLRTINVRFG